VAGDSRDKALELARNMEGSRHFSQTYIESEHPAPANSGDTVQFAINGIYLSQVAAASPTTPAPAPKPATPTPKIPTKTPTKTQTPKGSKP